MDWLRDHPYTAALGAAGLLLITGAAVVGGRQGAEPSNAPRVWSGSGQALLNPSSYTPNAVLEAQSYFSQATDTPLYRLTSGNGVSEDTPFDFDELIAQLSRPRTSSSLTVQAPGESYSFTPAGLISTSSRSSSRTDLQQSLFNYGNEAGSFIASYEERHRSAPVVLRDQAEDRTNPQKAEAAREIGRALAQVGRNLEGMEAVPASIQPTHALLASSYIDIGAKLQKVPDGTGDQAFIAAISEYNAAVDIFTKRYVAVALLLSAHGVVFTPYESGSVFTFSNTSL